MKRYDVTGGKMELGRTPSNRPRNQLHRPLATRPYKPNGWLLIVKSRYPDRSFRSGDAPPGRDKS